MLDAVILIILSDYLKGMFSGVLTMTSFNTHMGDYTVNQTKKGWLTSILELGAWVGTLVSNSSPKYSYLLISEIVFWIPRRNYLTKIRHHR